MNLTTVQSASVVSQSFAADLTVPSALTQCMYLVVYNWCFSTWMGCLHQLLYYKSSNKRPSIY